MKLYKYSFALMMGIAGLTSCADKLDVTNPNQQTSESFGLAEKELEESVIACYNHIRMEGTYARVGYTIDVCRGDEAWNSSQVWYMPFDDLNEPFTDEIGSWSWRDWYYTINVCNSITDKIANIEATKKELNTAQKHIKGQALFLRALSYYNLAGYYQNPILNTKFVNNLSLDELYFSNSTFDEVLDQCETDLKEAKNLLPKRDEGGEWSKGRATCGAAAGYLARVLMQRQKYSEALTVLTELMSQDDGGKELYGKYKLMPNYGDNFREGEKYENNDESLFEIQYLDYGKQGTDDEWTPVNTSKNATQGNAVESNFGPGDCGGWADISASPWLYNLFKEEKTKAGKLDPRLYWTIGTYEDDWNGFEYGNVCYTLPMSATEAVVTNNNNGGLPIAKHTNLRTGLYDKVVTGLHNGINLRMMRYSDVLLRAAECINETGGSTEEAVELINKVRRRANLEDLDPKDFNNQPDKLFEQIANVERPKEFGCEYGRGLDLLRWGFFYSADRLQQLKEHGSFRRSADRTIAKNPVTYAEVEEDKARPQDERLGFKSSFDTYSPGHEFLPIYQGTLNANKNLQGNSANNNIDNSAEFKAKYKIHPVVNLK